MCVYKPMRSLGLDMWGGYRMRAKDNRCGGVKNKNDKGLGTCGRYDTIKNG